jgi:hypothetical protein
MWSWLAVCALPGAVAAVTLWFLDAKRMAVVGAILTALAFAGIRYWIFQSLEAPLEGDVPGVIILPFLFGIPGLVFLLSVPPLVATQRRKPGLAVGLVVGVGLATLLAIALFWPLAVIVWGVALWIALGLPRALPLSR